MVASASLLPLNNNVASLVIASPTTPVSSLSAVITGAGGGTESTLMLKSTDNAEILPARSVDCAVRIYAPSAKLTAL